MAFQQRKKDYLQRLIEDFFQKFQLLVDRGVPLPVVETERILREGFKFFTDNLGVERTDESTEIRQKIEDFDLLEQYAQLLKTEYEVLEEDGDCQSLRKALEILEYIQAVDTTFSWERTILYEDILRLLSQENEMK